MTVSAKAKRYGVSVEVAPGGSLRSLTLAPDALHLGGTRLARTILALVREATSKANERAAIAMRAELGGLTDDELAALGLATDSSVTGSGTAGPTSRGTR